MRESTVKRLLGQIEVEEAYGIPCRTLEGFRFRGGGPAFIKLGRRVYYRIEDLDEWIDSKRCLSTSQYESEIRDD